MLPAFTLDSAGLQWNKAGMAFDFPEIDPVAFSLGPFGVRWYALAYIAGILLGWRYALHLVGWDDKKRPNETDIEDFISWAIVGVILGGRLGYVLFYNFDFYAENPLDAFKVWEGGMAFHGGILGIIGAMALFSRLKGVPFLRLTDIVACAAPIGLFFGRIANFINGELYGRVSDVPWAVKFPAGGYVPRHPSQLYEALLEGVVLFILLWALSRRESLRECPGVLSAIFLIGYGAARFTVEFFRQPDAQIGFLSGGFSMGQVLCLPMILAGVGLIAYARRNGQSA